MLTHSLPCLPAPPGKLWQVSCTFVIFVTIFVNIISIIIVIFLVNIITTIIIMTMSPCQVLPAFLHNYCADSPTCLTSVIDLVAVAALQYSKLQVGGDE